MRMDLVEIGPTVSLARSALLLVVNSLSADFGLGMYPAVKISVMGAVFVLYEAVKSASLALVGRYVFCNRRYQRSDNNEESEEKNIMISKLVWCLRVCARKDGLGDMESVTIKHAP